MFKVAACAADELGNEYVFKYRPPSLNNMFSKFFPNETTQQITNTFTEIGYMICILETTV